MRTRFGIGRWAFGVLIVGLALLCGCGSGPGVFVASAKVEATDHPLVARYTVNAAGPGKVWVEFGSDTNYGKQTSLVTAPDGFPNQAMVLVAGMKASTTYHMRAHVDYDSGESWIDDDHSFKTGPLPAKNALSLQITRPPNPAVQQSGVELLDVLALQTDNLEGLVTDLDGNVIWYYAFESKDLWPFPLKPLPNTHILLNASNHELREVDLSGKLIRNLSIDELNNRLSAAGLPSLRDGSLHHDFAVLPSGHFIMLGTTTKTFTDLPGYPGDTDVVGDVLIDLDPDWNPVWMWSTFDHLDINRHLFGLPDWTHGNAVVYSPSDGNLLMSMRHQGWIIKIDYANGQGAGGILWKLGNEGDFSISGGDPSQWFYAQHYPFIENQNGSQMGLAVFDNGNMRKDDVGNECAGPYPNCYTRAVIMDVDESVRTAAVRWQDLPGFFSAWGGSISVLDNGDIEFNSSAPQGNTPTSRILEVTPTLSPEVVWQMDISGGNAYRAYRIPSLYPDVVWQ
jgi:arylsulfate sulfotransferase